MRVWLISAFLAVLGIASNASTTEMCPSDWFDVSFTIIVDRLVLAASFSSLDANLSHFKDTLKLTDEEIEQVTQEAFTFYNTTYGLDFTTVEPNNAGQRVLGNATFFPFRIPFDITVSHNRWVVNGKTGLNRCFYMQEGGYDVQFSGTQRLYGTYGGDQGIVVPGADQISYSLLNFNFCRQQPTIILCKAPTPTIRNVDGYAVRIGDCYNRELGSGLFQGVQGRLTTDDPKFIHIVLRHVLTFPPHTV